MCIAGFILSSYSLMTDFRSSNRYFRIIFTLFMLYQSFIIAKGMIYNIEFSFDNIWNLLNDYPVTWSFVIPFFVFFTKNIKVFLNLFDWIIIIGVVFLGLCLVFSDILTTRTSSEYLVSQLSIGCAYTLLFAKYLNSRNTNIAFIVALIGLLSLTYLARRGGMLSFILFFLAGYIISLFSIPKPFIFKLFPLFLFIILIFYFNNPTLNSTFTSRLERRMTEDTRSGVFEMFFLGMRDDMTFGKGMYGTYYCPISGEDEEQGVEWAEVDYREIIENGYLQLILSGGIVYLVLFVLILLPAAILGLFKSSNQLTRSCGIVILFWLIDMFIYGLPTLSLHYVFVWICVGACYHKKLRERTDDDVLSEIQFVN